MAYLLDTDIYIYLSAGNTAIHNKIKEIGDENIYISSISVAELYFGAFNSLKKDDNLYKIQKNLEKLQILDFDKRVAKVFGRLKTQLRKKGTPLADMDVAIAAITLQHGLVLVSHNTRHFSLIEELLLEDWF